MILHIISLLPLYATECGGLSRCIDLTIPQSDSFLYFLGFMAGLFLIRLSRYVLDILP